MKHVKYTKPTVIRPKPKVKLQYEKCPLNKSISREFAKLGKYATEGITEGITDREWGKPMKEKGIVEHLKEMSLRVEAVEKRETKHQIIILGALLAIILNIVSNVLLILN